MNAKFYVPLETAKLLRTNGYPQSGSDMYYDLCGNLTPDNGFIPIDDDVCAAAPAYCEVLDWLWTNYALDIVTDEVGHGDYNHTKGRWSNREVGFNGRIEKPHPHYLHLNRNDYTGGFYSTREEAFNAAIIKVLEIYDLRKLTNPRKGRFLV